MYTQYFILKDFYFKLSIYIKYVLNCTALIIISNIPNSTLNNCITTSTLSCLYNRALVLIHLELSSVAAKVTEK